ncbi:glucitol operon GutQ protein [Klebsiella pneumoniae]|nr:glucitol operon GutQ protein [Klebsiella pneumoniae]
MKPTACRAFSPTATCAAGWFAGGTLNDGVTRAMTRNGVTLQADSRAVEAKERLMKHKISAAPVVDENGQLVGAINLQNFYQAGIL